MEEAEGKLAAADVLAAWWWLEERQCGGVICVVKMAAVFSSVGSSSLNVNSQRSPDMLC